MFAAWAVPFVLLALRSDAEADHTACTRHARSVLHCFEASETPRVTHETCDEDHAGCEALRTRFWALAPRAELSECFRVEAVWSVQYFNPVSPHELRRHWAPDRETCESYRTLLTTLGPGTEPSACVSTAEERLRICLAYQRTARERND